MGEVGLHQRIPASTISDIPALPLHNRDRAALKLASLPRAPDAAEINASCAGCSWECVMIKKIASIILAVGCAGLIIAFIPPLASVEEAFATARGSLAEIAAPSQPQANAPAKIWSSGS
jgi:hypothetical protein